MSHMVHPNGSLSSVGDQQGLCDINGFDLIVFASLTYKTAFIVDVDVSCLTFSVEILPAINCI